MPLGQFLPRRPQPLRGQQQHWRIKNDLLDMGPRTAAIIADSDEAQLGICHRSCVTQAAEVLRRKRVLVPHQFSIHPCKGQKSAFIRSYQLIVV